MAKARALTNLATKIENLLFYMRNFFCFSADLLQIEIRNIYDQAMYTGENMKQE